MTKEKEYYEIIKIKLEELFKSKFESFHLEITADKEFSNKLKAEIEKNKEIIFKFLKEFRPDITGFVKENGSSYFVVVEIKDEVIKLDHIYQIRKYAELLGAKYTLLISTFEIPDEIKRLDKVIYPHLLTGGYAYERIIIVHFNTKTQQFVEWYEKNQFEKT